MNPFALCAFGLILAGVGVFMYRSPRALDLIHLDPFGRSPLWRELVYLAVLGMVPEGLGLILGGLLGLIQQYALAVSYFLRQTSSYWACGLLGLLGPSPTGCAASKLTGEPPNAASVFDQLPNGQGSRRSRSCQPPAANYVPACRRHHHGGRLPGQPPANLYLPAPFACCVIV